MREIKFRGRGTLTGKWIYGDLVHRHDGSLAIFPLPIKCTMESVIPESIAQFIGKDKNDKEIYEGDTVVYTHHDTGHESIMTLHPQTWVNIAKAQEDEDFLFRHYALVERCEENG